MYPHKQFYVKQLKDDVYAVYEDPGRGNGVSETLVTFQTEWGANEYCRMCTQLEHIVRPKLFATGLSALAYTGSITANGCYNTTRSINLGGVTLATMNNSGVVTDIYLERLFVLWIKIKYEKHIKLFFNKLWNGGW